MEDHMDCKANYIKWPPKTKWLPNHKTDHNSLNFQARSSRFCMVVHIDLLQITHFGKQNGHQITKLIITHSIFKKYKKSKNKCTCTSYLFKTEIWTKNVDGGNSYIMCRQAKKGGL